jgi:predicted nucleic acid-binding Zn ribbon protein
MEERKRGKEFTILIVCLIGALLAFMIAGATGR